MRLTSAAFTLFILTFLDVNARAQGSADAIYHGGEVVTIDDKNPIAQAVAIKDGKIIDGVLEETAFMVSAVKVLPKMGEAELDRLGLAGQRLYAANGYTFAQEGRSNIIADKTWMRLAEAKKMLIDVASYPDLTFSDTPFGLDTPWYSKSFKNRYRIAGVKLSFDGSPQGKTAFLSQPYFIPPHGQPSNFLGYPTIPVEEVNRKIALCYKKGWQFLAHCNGDAAGDMMIGTATRCWGPSVPSGSALPAQPSDAE